MKINRVLLVYKKSSYQRHALDRKDRHFLKLLRQNNISSWSSRQTHERHMKTLQVVKNILSDFGIHYDVRLRYRLDNLPSYDLVITIGGDGTFLETSHFIRGTPIMGINSTPAVSVGYFCKTDSESFKRKMKRFLQGNCRFESLHRVRATVNGKPAGPLALNDILFTSRNPADTSRYLIGRGKRREEQKSSGVWIASAAGSTAAIASAGGKTLPLHTAKFEYRVRELYHTRGKTCRLLHGILSPHEKLTIVSNMNHGALYFDGPHSIAPVRRGDVIRFEQANDPVRAIW